MMNLEQIKNKILSESIKDSIHLLIEISEGDSEGFLAPVYARLILARLESAIEKSEKIKGATCQQ